MKKLLIGIFVFFFSLYLKAGSDTTILQDDTSRYINRYGSAFFDGIKTNPAYTGLLGQHVINSSYRLFLIKPNMNDNKTHNYYMDYTTNLGKNKNFGIGGYYDYSKIIYTQMHEINISASYRFDIVDKINIGIGASAITYYRSITKINNILITHPATDPNDSLLQERKITEDRLNYNIGLWFNCYGFYFGISYLDFFTYYFDSKDIKFLHSNATYHIISGYDFRIAEKWGLSPTIYYGNIHKKNRIYKVGIFSDYDNIVFWGMTYKDQTQYNNKYLGYEVGGMIIKRIRISYGYELSLKRYTSSIFDYSHWYFGLRLQY